MFPQKEFGPSHVDLEAEKMTNNEIRAAMRHLRKGVQKWVDVYGEEHWEYPLVEFPDGYYHCHYHPYQEFDLLSDTNIISIFQYATPGQSLARGGAPAIYGCTFFRSTEPVEIDDDDFVVVTGSTIAEKPGDRFTAVFKGVRNGYYD